MIALASPVGSSKIRRLTLWPTRGETMNPRNTCRPLLTLVSVCTLLACKVSVGGSPGKAAVDCKGTSTQINCDVKHTEGDQPITACWDLRFDCANGSVSEAKKLCQDVAPASTARRVVPLDALSNADKCDKVVGSQVLNLALTLRR
jgi:hypothetical protein